MTGEDVTEQVMKVALTVMNSGSAEVTKAFSDIAEYMDDMAEKIEELEARPSIAVDLIIVTEREFVAIKRKNEPFKGMYALPGGFVEPGESTEEAARREAKEETGLDVMLHGIVGVYSKPGRDPRKSVVSICYLATATGTLQAGDDAAEAGLVPYDSTPELAFDHNQMIEDAKRLY